jgi:hypothetical protein
MNELTFGNTPTVKLTENKLSHNHNFHDANFEYCNLSTSLTSPRWFFFSHLVYCWLPHSLG